MPPEWLEAEPRQACRREACAVIEIVKQAFHLTPQARNGVPGLGRPGVPGGVFAFLHGHRSLRFSHFKIRLWGQCTNHPRRSLIGQFDSCQSYTIVIGRLWHGMAMRRYHPAIPLSRK